MVIWEIRVLDNILDSHLHEVVLFLTVIIWYFMYKNAANSEIDLLGRLHSAGRLPEKFGKYANFYTVLALSLGLTLSFIMMVCFVNYFLLFCLFLLIVSIQDLFGNRTIINQLRHLQSGNNSDIPNVDPKKPVIIELRRECYNYWNENSQIERIVSYITFNLISLFLYLFIEGFAFYDILSPNPVDPIEDWLWHVIIFRNPEFTGYNYVIVISYIITILAIIWNESTMHKWRKIRNTRLQSIFARELEVDRAIATGSPLHSEP